MTAKEWLIRARKLDRRVKALEESRQRAYDRCILAAARLRETPGYAGNKSANKNNSYAILSNEVDQQLDELNGIRTEILHMIRGVDDAVLATILIEYYVNGKNWETIADEQNYSYAHIRKTLHPKALGEIEKRLHKAT